jgi:hypothetical protein
MTAPLCPYCGATSVLVTGDVIYPWRRDLAEKQFYRCSACPDAYVGCHPGTTNPLGRLADAKLRLAKSHAHAVFDPLWEAKVEREGLSKGHARGKGYTWLAAQLGIDPKDCHIGMMDVETCMRVVVICRPYVEKLK